LADLTAYATLRKAALNLLEYKAVYAPDFDMNAFIMTVAPFMNTAFVIDIITSRNYDLLRLIWPLLIDIHQSTTLVAEQKAKWVTAVAKPLADRLASLPIDEQPIDYVRVIKQMAALDPFPTAIIAALLNANNLDLAHDYERLVEGASATLRAMLERRRKQLGGTGDARSGTDEQQKRRKLGVEAGPHHHRGTVVKGAGPVCAMCHHPADFICTGCRMVAYCSNEHQQADWLIHQANCGMHTQ
jgi:hypothetical protein